MNGSWCPYCSRVIGAEHRRKYTIEDFDALAHSRGGRCLAKHYQSVTHPILWQCAVGHRWRASPYHVVVKGSWCALCAVSYGEGICRAYFEQIFLAPFPKQRPPWLRLTSRSQLELDGYCSDLGIAFEHQGRQHFEHVEYYHPTREAFERQQYFDHVKRQRCLSHGVTLIEVPSIGDILKMQDVQPYIIDACVRQELVLPAGYASRVINVLLTLRVR